MQHQDIKEEIINRLVDLGITKASLINNSGLEQIKSSLLKELEGTESYLFFFRILAYFTSALTIGIILLHMFLPGLGIALNSASLLVLWTITNVWVLKRYQLSCDRTKEKIFLIKILEKS